MSVLAVVAWVVLLALALLVFGMVNLAMLETLVILAAVVMLGVLVMLVATFIAVAMLTVVVMLGALAMLMLVLIGSVVVLFLLEVQLLPDKVVQFLNEPFFVGKLVVRTSETGRPLSTETSSMAASPPRFIISMCLGWESSSSVLAELDGVGGLVRSTALGRGFKGGL
jgi:hypothetical protein